MSPKSPYGAAKLYSHNITQMYRDSIIYLLVQVFFLIMRAQEEVKLLLQERLQCFLLNG